ncbi:MAG TPA: PKD domain-containing protein, partial [Phnomibacter sp.]|nr:PKD domain-containing protein [Phnomibacter sp.]
MVLDTWRNCGTDNIPKVQIRWGAGYDECNGQPTRNNNDGQLSFIRSTTFNKCRIEYDEGNITVFLNGTEYLKATQTFNFTGYFGFTASTGGSRDRHSIKNVRIFTEMPPSNAGPDKVICPGETTQIGVPATPGNVYRWIPSQGITGPSLSNPLVSLTNDGEMNIDQQYIVETAYADRPGCVSRDSVTVTILAKPRPNFSHDTVCLPGGDIKFTNLTRYLAQPDLNLTWNWNFGDPPSGASNTSSLAQPMHFYGQRGPFTVTLSVTSPQGCTNTITRTIEPVVAAPTTLFSITGDTCSGYDIRFEPTVIQDPVLPLIYQWQFGDGSSSAQPSPTHQYQAGGAYNASLVVSNPYCSGTKATRVIQIRPSPVLSLTGDLPTPCKNDAPFILNMAGISNGLSGQGSYTGPAVQGNRFFPANALSSDNQVIYNFVADNGCEADLPFMIKVVALPVVNAGPDRVSLEAKPVQLNGTVSPGVVSFSWNPISNMSDPSVLNPVVNPPNNTQYVLTAIGEANCLAMDSVFVTVLPGLFIPNAFSPNGDGINDVWVIKHLDEYPGSSVQIFDRYGKVVFSSIGYNQPWDGKQNGIPLPSGVYYYIIDPKNGATRRQGS